MNGLNKQMACPAYIVVEKNEVCSGAKGVDPNSQSSAGARPLFRASQWLDQ